MAAARTSAMTVGLAIEAAADRGEVVVRSRQLYNPPMLATSIHGLGVRGPDVNLGEGKDRMPTGGV